MTSILFCEFYKPISVFMKFYNTLGKSEYLLGKRDLGIQVFAMSHSVISFMLAKTTASRHFGLACFSSFKPEPYTGLPRQEAWKLHQSHMFPFYKPYYKEPFYAVQGHRQYLYNDKGQEFIDLAGGISTVNVGHCHPRLNAVFEDQAKKMMHISPIYMHEYHGEYCKALCDQLGGGFEVAYLCNSGSEANDFAHLLARIYTGSERVMGHRKGYHGIAGHAYSLTNCGTWSSPMPKISEVERLACPNLYRYTHHTVDTLVQEAQDHIRACSNHKIAGFWAEPVLGVGGVVPLPEGYFKKMADLTRKYGGLVVSDEVQTGFGRIGKEFWGFKWHGVKPDIVVTAKAMANGYPMAAVITSKKIMSAWKHSFFNTYGAGAMQCRLGLEVLKILKEEKLPENASEVGEFMIQGFKKAQKKSNRIGDARGKGMMAAIELVKDKESKIPDAQLTVQYLEEFKKEGILMAKAGEEGNIIRCVGPLCLSKKDAEKVLQVLDHCVAKYG